MSTINLGRLKKNEIVQLYKQRCRHGHRYIEHLNCYTAEQQKSLRIGFLDIEASNLSADFGIVFCYAIKVYGEDKVIGRIITNKELRTVLDKNVVRALIDDIQQFDVIITYYGTKFDLPFIRTRALYWGLDFPPFGEIQHKDIYYIIKNKFRLSRSRLEYASRVLVGETNKTRIDSVYWIKALQGDKKSLNYIYDHCIRDVRDLEKLYEKVIKFVSNSTNSI